MDKSYWELFFGESEEYLSQINKCLVTLEKDPGRGEAINEVFRLMHTLKGMAATMGFSGFAEFAHKIEDVFDDLRSCRRQPTSSLMDTIFSCIDAMELMLDELRRKKEPSINVADYIAKLQIASERERPIAPDQENISKELDSGWHFSSSEIARLKTQIQKGFDIIKIDITLADDCPMKEARVFLIIIRVKQMGEVMKIIPSEDDLKQGKFALSFSIILSAKEGKKTIKDELSCIWEIKNVDISFIKDSDLTNETGSSSSAPGHLKKIQSMRIPVERLDKIMNFMGELSIAKSRLLQIVQSKDLSDLGDAVFVINRLVSSLQDETLQMRLLPISYLLDTFPRVVRDLARKSQKEIDLTITGGEIELDRVILDEIGDSRSEEHTSELQSH